MAKLRFYYGCMGSSKTLRLLTTAYNFDERGIAYCALKPSKDTRDGEAIIKSRAGLERTCAVFNEEDNLYDVIHEFKNFISSTRLKDVKFILIDECQFLTAKQVDELTKVVDKLGINVFCYGLRTDFKTNLFEGSRRLFEVADEMEEVPSMCDCGNRTSVNARFDEDGHIIIEGDQVLIGGNDKYKAICRNCYRKAVEKELVRQESKDTKRTADTFIFNL